MAIKISTFQNVSSKFTQNIILDNIPITLTIKWNVRAEAWFLAITDGTITLAHKKLVINWPLLRQCRSYMPLLQGDFLLLRDTLDVEEVLTYDNLNDGYTLYYMNESELISWEDQYGLG